MTADALLEASARLTAVIVKTPAVTAVKVAEELVWLVKVPFDVVQVTPAFDESLWTVAVRESGCATVIPDRTGVMLTVTPEDCTIVIAEVPFFVPSAIDVPVSVTVPGVGEMAGAVYVTEEVVLLVSVPQAEPEHPLPERLQFTPTLPTSFRTLAMKAADWLS
jgi:hypothetical protein